MNIAITGATGFIGRYTALALAREGHSIRALARPGREDAVPHPKDHGGTGEFDVFTGDLDHLPDVEMREVTVAGTESLVEEAIRANPKRDRIQMWIMSSAVIGAPVYSYYRDTKRIQEKIFKGSGFEWTSFRPTLVYGVGDYRHTATTMRKCAAQGGKMTIPHSGRSKINPVHVDDVVDCVLRKIGYDKQVTSSTTPSPQRRGR